MKSQLKSLLSLLAIICIFASCAKEFSVENGTGAGSTSGTSVYTYAGAPSACIAPVIGGLYTVGTAAGPDNTVELSVNVTKAGTYIISTPKINGLTFTASGTFAATGIQTVIFTASGTPVIKGTFPYSPGSNGCSFPITVIPATATNTSTFTFASAPNACDPVDIKGTYMVGVPLSASNTVAIQATVTKAGTYSISTVAANGMTFSGSGTFAATGLQTITLVGSGTPVAAVSSVFLPVPNGCSFTIAVVAAAPPAVFTLQSAAGTCSNVIVKGTYAVGQDLTPLNTVTVVAVVTTAGSFSITTPTINGISFGGTGNFSVAGNYNLNLLSNGTPVAAGTNTFTFPAAIGGCSFTVTTTATAPPVATDGVIKCTIDGVAKTFNFDASGIVTQLSTAPDPPFIDMQIVGWASATANEMVNFEVSKDGSAFSAGDFFNETAITGGKHYTFNYVEESGTTFSADDGGFVPVPFNITITSITETRAVGTFSGTVIDVNTNTNKVITNGTFNVPL